MSAASRSSQQGSENNARIAERVAVMRASAFFGGLPQQDCTEIASSAMARSFETDERLFMQGQQSRHLVMIQTGRVKLTQISLNGGEVIMGMKGSGVVVGMPWSSPLSNHTCSATAMEQCHALVWEFTKFEALLGEFPQIRKNITWILTGSLDELEERFREVATEQVAQRLALALLRLAKELGKPVARGTEVNASREEFAQMTGTTLFTVSRVLTKWAAKGIVLPRRNAVVILDPRRLVQVSESSPERSKTGG